MEYRQLGRSGVRVSKMCFGAMWFGDRTEIDEARLMLNEALDAGINFVDTANVYAKGGGSEEMLGALLAENGRRDEIVLATKGMAWMGSGPNDHGASRYHLVRAVEASLRRLKTDRIDVYYLHSGNLENAPLDEIMETLDILIQQGKILYPGTSKWPPTQLMDAIALGEHCGAPRIVVEQPAYNLTDRRVELELVWACLRHGIGLVTFGPLARGILSGVYRKGQPAPEGHFFHTLGKGEKDGADRMKRYSEATMDLVEKLMPLAEEKGVSLAEFSLAWLMHRPGVTAPITGARNLEQLRSSLRACEVALTDDDLRRVDEIIPPGTHVSNYYDVLDPVCNEVAQLAFREGKG